jgi:hypothetical protein
MKKTGINDLGLSREVEFAAARVRAGWDSRTETNRKRVTAGLPPIKDRSKVISIRASAAEKQLLKDAAEVAGLTLQLWALDFLLEKASHEGSIAIERTDSTAKRRRVHKNPNPKHHRMPQHNSCIRARTQTAAD